MLDSAPLVHFYIASRLFRQGALKNVSICAVSTDGWARRALSNAATGWTPDETIQGDATTMNFTPTLC